MRSTPSTTGSGKVLPERKTVTFGPVSSVVVRLAPPPGRYSEIEPSTLTLSPAVTFLASLAV